MGRGDTELCANNHTQAASAPHRAGALTVSSAGNERQALVVVGEGWQVSMTGFHSVPQKPFLATTFEFACFSPLTLKPICGAT